MPEYLSPGVYVEEQNKGSRPIEGVGTAMAAFVGFAPAGPSNRPMLITNWSQYIETFGRKDQGGLPNPHMENAYLSHCVYGYFLNGGGRCYVTRVVPPEKAASPASLQLPSKSSKAQPAFTITPKGETSANIEIEVRPATIHEAPKEPPKEEGGKEGENKAPRGRDTSDGLFTLRIKMGSQEETYENVSVNRPHARNVVETVNQASGLVTILETAPPATPTGDLVPATGRYDILASPEPSVPEVNAKHFEGDVAQRSGVMGLEIAEDVTMVCCPDLMSVYQANGNGNGLSREGVKAVQLAIIAHCEAMRDRIAILDPLPGLSPQEVLRWRREETNYDSKYAALYYPWIKIAGPDGKPMEVPPCGHVAGIYARNDTERGVHKAPANEVVTGGLGAVTQVTKGEQDLLNPEGINCIRSFPGRGLRVWGARTLSSDPAWRYVNVRRLFNFIEKSIERGTQWVVFEPNDLNLWERVKRDVTAFLTVAWRDGMLFGATPSQAFFVKCDEELNPPETRDLGRLIIEIGLAPVKPAEFVIFRFSQWTGGGA